MNERVSSALEFRLVRRVFLKPRVNCTAVWDVNRRAALEKFPVERLNVHLSLLVKRFVPTTVIRVRNKDKPWFNDD